MHYVYFLLLRNGDIYKGRTDDLHRRINEHRQGKVESTRNFRPLKIIGYESYLLESDAIRREKFLKTTESRRLFKQQYRDVLLAGFRSYDRTGSDNLAPRHSTGRPVG